MTSDQSLDIEVAMMREANRAKPSDRSVTDTVTDSDRLSWLKNMRGYAPIHEGNTPQQVTDSDRLTTFANTTSVTDSDRWSVPLSRARMGYETENDADRSLTGASR